MEGSTGLRSAYTASRIARARADAEGAWVRDHLLGGVDAAIGRACREGRRFLDYELPMTTGRRPVEDILRALEQELRRRNYRTERLRGRPRALRIRWGDLWGL